MHYRQTIEWTPDAIERLRQLWDEGHSATTIGKAFGVTKNAVLGKAHRLKLSARGPSYPRTSKLKVPPPPPVTPPTPRATLPKLASLITALPATEGNETVKVEGQASLFDAPQQSAVVLQFSTREKCQWIDGHPGSGFCGRPSLLGLSWCEDHRKRVFVRKAEGVA